MKKFVVRKDCFAYNGTKSCSCLKELYCSKEECKFYKPDINGKYDWQIKRADKNGYDYAAPCGEKLEERLDDALALRDELLTKNQKENMKDSTDKVRNKINKLNKKKGNGSCV